METNIGRPVLAHELLAGCCVSCGAVGGDCGGAHATSSPLFSHPGALDPSGPLAHEVQGELARLVGTEPTRENRVRLLIDGIESYGAMLDLVGAARTDIRFENFIYRDDTVGRAFAEALLRRADAGVDVKVLYDPFGSVMSRRLPIGRRFRASTGRVRIHNPVRPTRAFLRGGRNHRKTVTVDGRRFVSGGMCLADVWSGNCIRHCTWRDSAVAVEGPAAAELAREFDRAWSRATRIATRSGFGAPASVPTAPEGGQLTEPGDAKRGEVPVRVLAGRPRLRLLERVLVRVFDAAEIEILITNPYFLPTDAILASLLRAARRGVSVQVLIPAHNNHRVVGLASEHVVKPLIEAGGTVWMWLGPMIHAKTVVVDRRWSVVGSSNLDALSLRKNLELDVEIHGSSMGDEMAAVFERDRANCARFDHQAWSRRTRTRRTLARVAAAARRFL